MEDFIYSYKKMFANYFVFEGRTPRSDYWQAFAVNIVVGAVLVTLSRLLPMLGILNYIYGIAAVVPVLTMTVRRLHDTDKSGWWALAAFFPVPVSYTHLDVYKRQILRSACPRAMPASSARWWLSTSTSPRAFITRPRAAR